MRQMPLMICRATELPKGALVEWQVTTRLLPAYRDEEEDCAETGQAARFVFSDDVAGTGSDTRDTSYEIDRLQQVCSPSPRLRTRRCACSLEATVSNSLHAHLEYDSHRSTGRSMPSDLSCTVLQNLANGLEDVAYAAIIM